MAGIEPSNEKTPRSDWDADDFDLAHALARVSIPAEARQRAVARLRLEGLLDEELAASHVETDYTCAVSLDAEPLQPEVAVNQPATQSIGRSQPTGSRRKWLAMAAATLAVTAAGVFLYVRALPISPSQLTARCTAMLEQTLAGEAAPNWQLTALSQRLNALSDKVTQRLTLVGSVEIEDPQLAKECRLYKFTARNGTLQVYVFDFIQPRAIAGLGSQLQALTAPNSTWSLAAMQGEEQLLVVATDGDLQQFFRSLQLA